MLNSTKERLALLNPTFAYHVGRLLTSLELAGIWAEVCQGLRSWNEQQTLYEKGRKLINGTWTVFDPKSIVTKCKPGYSWHNFGLAVDICLDNTKYDGFQAVWDDKDPRWRQAATIGESLGFTAGADFRTFPDNPHYEMTGKYPASLATPQGDEIRQLFKDGGMQAIWDAVALK